MTFSLPCVMDVGGWKQAAWLTVAKWPEGPRRRPADRGKGYWHLAGGPTIPNVARFRARASSADSPDVTVLDAAPVDGPPDAAWRSSYASSGPSCVVWMMREGAGRWGPTL